MESKIVSVHASQAVSNRQWQIVDEFGDASVFPLDFSITGSNNGLQHLSIYTENGLSLHLLPTIGIARKYSLTVMRLPMQAEHAAVHG